MTKDEISAKLIETAETMEAIRSDEFWETEEGRRLNAKYLIRSQVKMTRNDCLTTDQCLSDLEGEAHVVGDYKTMLGRRKEARDV